MERSGTPESPVSGAPAPEMRPYYLQNLYKRGCFKCKTTAFFAGRLTKAGVSTKMLEV
jgi:hypothetical protein